MDNLNVDSQEFNQVFVDIKRRYLASNNFPKLIVGTGLSISMDIPGMSALAKKLDEEFNNIDDINLKGKWNNYKSKIETDGLEAALLNVSESEELFVEKIREITSEFILDKEYFQHSNIQKNISGFEELLKYLSNTVSVNAPLIDIMTPNYDRIIEIICDKLNLRNTLGFYGNIYQTFDSNILRNPFQYYTKHIPLVRLFKPHGSVNWVKINNTEYQSNDYIFLKDNKKHIDIIAPGSSKYKAGMINEIFRCHREIFNELISGSRNRFSIFIYGYGFNDQHFNTVFENTERDVIVLTRTIKKSFVEKALKKDNWTIFYHNEEDNEENKDKNYMIYKCKKYSINKELWDINVFSEIFLG